MSRCYVDVPVWPVCGVLIYPPRTVSRNSSAVRSANSVTAILQLSPGRLLCSEILRRLLWKTWNLQDIFYYKTTTTSYIKLTCETPPQWRGRSSHDQLWTSGTGPIHQSQRWERRGPGREIWGAGLWSPLSPERAESTNNVSGQSSPYLPPRTSPTSLSIYHTYYLSPRRDDDILQRDKNHQTSFIEERTFGSVRVLFCCKLWILVEIREIRWVHTT